MASLNRVFLIGNLTRDPELRYIPAGTAVATFTIAANRTYASKTGEKKEEVCFMRVVVWARMAEVCGEFLSKGSPVFVEGRLQSRNWEDANGQKRSTVEVVATNVQFLGSKGKGQAGPVEGQEQQIPTNAESEMKDIPPPDDMKNASEEAPF